MKESGYKTKALIRINGKYVELEIELTQQQKDLLDSYQKQTYSMGATFNPDTVVEDYPQT